MNDLKDRFLPAVNAQGRGFKCLSLLLLLIGFAFGAKAQPDYAPAIWNQTYPGHWYTTSSAGGHYFCVIHDMETYYEACISYFQQSNTEADANYLVNSLQNGTDIANNYVENNPLDAPSGQITQMVREKYWAWHVLCWNPYMFGTEHEGFVDSPVWYTETMYQASAGLQRHLCTTYNIPMDRNHIIGHNEWQNTNWTAWMSTNWPQIDTTCNDHTDPGVYWNWTHFMQLVTTGTNIPPSISYAFLNHAVDQGSNFTFSVNSLGTAPLVYQWYLNSNKIAGVSSSTYNIPSVQPANAGNYYVVITNAFGAVTSSVAVLTVNPTMNWVMVYSDNLNTDTSTNWKLFSGSGDGVTDYTTNWAFDYSTQTYTFNGVTKTIPVAPKTTNGTRLGLKITVNKNDSDAADSGVSLYPKNQSFSGNYALRFDMWMNYAGSSGGGTGSTEYSTFGINHTGTQINWGAGTASSSDGLWFAVTSEGGAANNDPAYIGNPTGNPTALSFASGGGLVNGAQSPVSTDPFFGIVFPWSTNETTGAAGKNWVQCEVSQVNGMLTWKMNGLVIAERINTSSYTNGNVMIGYMDIFPSIASPKSNNYVIFDNVQVFAAAVAPVIASQPQSVSVIQGSGTNATFSVTASSLIATTYQWQFNGTNIPSATASNYTLVNPQATNAGNYSVVISNSIGSVTSSNAALAVFVSPSITSPPVNRTVNQGNTAVFVMATAGSPPLSYQWQLGGNPVSGATNAGIVISNAQPSQAGNYQLVVSSPYGMVTSAVMVLTVDTPPTFLAQPQSKTVPISGSATFTAAAIGNPAPAYQWLFNGNAISGATSNTFSLVNIRTNNAGVYSVLVTNVVSSTNSFNAVLTVTIPQPQFQAITLSPNGAVQMSIAGQAGCVYAVDFSINLTNWSQVGSFTNSSGTNQFTDLSATNNPSGFYRVRFLSN